jgi:plastocyanin
MAGGRWAAVILAATLVAAGCGDDDDTASTDVTEADDGGGTTTPERSAQTVEIDVDGASEDFNMWAFAFYPSAVTLHPGDTIDFVGRFQGEPHTVASGTAVVEAYEGVSALIESVGDAEPTPEQEAQFEAFVGGVPQTFDPDFDAAAFEAGANNLFAQAGLVPCFITGPGAEVPTTEACPEDQREQPESFTGEETLYSHGFIADEEVFSVKLADDLAPGAYTFACLVHFGEMATEVTVVAPEQQADSPADVATRAEEELRANVEAARSAAEAVLDSTDPAAAQAGAVPESEDSTVAEITVFPRQLSVAPGGAVTWQINGLHTISFNAPESARPAFVRLDDGTFGVNPEASTPVGGPPSMINLQPPPDTPEGEFPIVPVDAGAFSGDGFFSSGLPPFTEVGATWTVTFPNAGTFEYLCLVHPDMEGVVNVA